MDGFQQPTLRPQAVAMRTQYERKLQQLLDQSVPHTAGRWAVFAVVVVLYIVRVTLLKGFYIVTYGIGIFNLNLVIGFLTPAFDPEQDAPTLPTTEQEFKPFVRRVPEFKFWCAARREATGGTADGRQRRSRAFFDGLGARTMVAASVALRCCHPYVAWQTAYRNSGVQSAKHVLNSHLVVRAPSPSQVEQHQVLPCGFPDDFFPHVRHPRLLAHSVDVLAHAFRPYDEATDPAHDQAPVLALHLRQAALRWEDARERQQVNGTSYDAIAQYLPFHARLCHTRPVKRAPCCCLESPSHNGLVGAEAQVGA